MGKFLVASIAVVGSSWASGALLNALGLDPRSSFMGTYVQRNALVVGFMMGFAIIPIIYTIAEDALSAVPEHLRSASLGCGATHWQTARRIIIPTAMSGLFSAIMVGLGRAVGETMIVLMAAGNNDAVAFPRKSKGRCTSDSSQRAGNQNHVGAHIVCPPGYGRPPRAGVQDRCS